MRLLITLAWIYSLTLSANLWAAYGDNTAAAPNTPVEDVSGPKVIALALDSNMKSGVRNVGIHGGQITELMEMDPDFKPGFWNIKGTDLETEKRIYEHIVTRYRKVPRYEAQQIASSIVYHSREKAVDPYLVAALVERESNFRKDAVSVHGARGLGQIMPFNLPRLNISDAFDISENISGTTLYLKEQLHKWAKVPDKTVQLALASYAEGPNAISRQNGQWKEKTSSYIDDIMQRYHKLHGRVFDEDQSEPVKPQLIEPNVGTYREVNVSM